MPRKSFPVLPLLLSLVLAAPALAQIRSEPPLTQQGDTLVLEALDHRFSLPLPDWLEPAERLSGDARALVEAVYIADENQALLEIFPKGENQALWTTLYGARITREASRPLTDYRNAVMSGYARSCKPELTGFFQFGEDQGETLAPLGFVCGAYLDHLTGHAGKGEVMIMSFRRTERGVAIVYQEWKGAAFDPSDPRTWPVDTEVVEARAAELQADAVLSLAD